MPRELAPILTGEAIVTAMQAALDEGQALEYRHPDSRKHGMVDITSCANVVSILKVLKPEVRAKLMTYATNPGRLALVCWNLVGSARAKVAQKAGG